MIITPCPTVVPSGDPGRVSSGTLASLSSSSGCSSSSSSSTSSGECCVNRGKGVHGSDTPSDSCTSPTTSASVASPVMVRPRKSREELDEANRSLMSLWDIDHTWIMVFDDLINNNENRNIIRKDSNGEAAKAYARKHTPPPLSKRKGEDETDRASVKSGGSKSRASSAPPVRRSVLGAAAPTSKANGGTAAGAVDEASFFASFEDVPKISIYSIKDLDKIMTTIRECIQVTQNDWDKRVEALKKIRSVIVAGGASYEEFYPHLRLLEPAMQLSIKDLRSQVVREACITVAYMSQELHHKVDHFCETELPTLVNLIPNTAKIMASAGVVTIRFIIQNTHHHKLIPVLTREMSSKSREIRKTISEFLDQLVHTWPTHSMEKHISILSEAIKKGITDADPEARANSRKAYWGFADHFREDADRLLNSLDPSYKKMLQGEMSASFSGSSFTSSAPQTPHQTHHSATQSRPGKMTVGTTLHYRSI